MKNTWRGALFLPWLALAACDAAPKMPFKEGQRLKAVYEQSEGAPPRFLGWHDTMLDVDCRFVDVGVPGRVVCMPTNPFDEVGRVLASERSDFADSNCTERLAFDQSPECQRRFLVRGPKEEDPCGTPLRLFSLGDTVDPAQVWHPTSDGGCTLPDLVTLETPRWNRRIGPEIPLDTLVSGTYRPATGPGRIVPLTIVGSDGSVQTDGTVGSFQTSMGGEAYPGARVEPVAWDTTREMMVTSYTPFWTKAPRWRPLEYLELGLFADADCTVPVAVDRARCGQRPTEVFGWLDVDACGTNTTTQAFELGAAAPAGTQVHYLDADGKGCLPHPGYPPPTDHPQYEVFNLGAPIAATEYAAVTEVRTGTKQLRLVQAATADGVGAYALGFYDSAHDVSCSRQTSADGTERCLPPGLIIVGSSFGDAACTVPLVELAFDQRLCGAKAPYVIRLEVTSPSTGECVASITRQHVHTLGSRYTGPIYVGEGLCTPVGETKGERDFYTVGPEVPAADFAPLKLVRPAPSPHTR